jgi:RNA polymerase sigma factor (TIGR02999 family)
MREGDREALNALIPLVHAELKRMARNKLRIERPEHTLNSTALVNEAYLKLVGTDDLQFESRAQFFALAANVMRNILVSHARSRRRLKRGGGAQHVSLSDVAEISVADVDRILDLDAALRDLEALNPRHSRIVECRFFAGMTIEETASALGISIATAKRDWNVLRIWLQRELGRKP